MAVNCIRSLNYVSNYLVRHPLLLTPSVFVDIQSLLCYVSIIIFSPAKNNFHFFVNTFFPFIAKAKMTFKV